MKPLHSQHPRRKAAVAASGPDPRYRLQVDFFALMGGVQQFHTLFDYLPDVHFFAKDAAGRFVAGSAGLLQRLGYTSEIDIIGKTDADIHPARVAREIREDDLRVMNTREPLTQRVEALFTRSQAKDWYVTTKLPIFAPNGEVIGIMGFVRPYRRNERSLPGAERLERVVTHIQTNHAAPIAVTDLARLANLSVRQLHRLFQEVFGMNTQTFLIRTRVQAASDDLLLTDKPLSQIAQEHGFCDQSAFCRRFFDHTGETPLKYRHRHQRNGSSNTTA
jgi:AraC-like DNA-binding protein